MVEGRSAASRDDLGFAFSSSFDLREFAACFSRGRRACSEQASPAKAGIFSTGGPFFQKAGGACVDSLSTVGGVSFGDVSDAFAPVRG